MLMITKAFGYHSSQIFKVITKILLITLTYYKNINLHTLFCAMLASKKGKNPLLILHNVSV